MCTDRYSILYTVYKQIITFVKCGTQRHRLIDTSVCSEA